MLIASLPSAYHGFDFLSSVSFLTSALVAANELEQWSSLSHDDHDDFDSGFMSAAAANPLVQHANFMPLFDATKKVQRFGENAFAAALLIAVLQAAVALYQYRSNPKGELIVPPGLTWGVEKPTDFKRVKHPSYTGRKKSMDKGYSRTLAVSKINNERETTGNSLQNMWTRPLSRLNRWLFLLMPWMSRQVSFIMQRNSHLFHIGFIMSLASLFGIRRPQFQTRSQEDTSLWTVDLHEKSGGRKSLKVVVIGDSLAVGLGCSNKFDPNKNSTTPMMRLEVLSRDASPSSEGKELRDSDDGGPAFPRVLARTLSQRLRSRVFWRSAGVDGGSVEDIEHYCLGVVQEEADKDYPPDIVVLLCGMNDLKTFVGNPFQSSSAVAYQRKLLGFIDDIRKYAPNCKVVLPALPIQMFHRNNILNIFPLALFLDTIIGFWDSQKQRVADRASNVLYVGLSAADISEWYKKSDHGDGTTLFAADGVHPNRRCYSYWAEEVGNKLADKLGCGVAHKMK